MHKSNCMKKESTQIMHEQSLINIYHISETHSYLFPDTTTRRVITLPTSYSVNLFAHIWTFNINEIVWYLFSCQASFALCFRESIYIVERNYSCLLSLLHSKKKSVNMPHLFIHPVESHLCRFQFGATMHSSAMSIYFSVFLWK